MTTASEALNVAVSCIRNQIHSLLKQSKLGLDEFKKPQLNSIVQRLTTALDSLPFLTNDAPFARKLVATTKTLIMNTTNMISVKHSGENYYREEEIFKKDLALFKIDFDTFLQKIENPQYVRLGSSAKGGAAGGGAAGGGGRGRGTPPRGRGGRGIEDRVHSPTSVVSPRAGNNSSSPNVLSSRSTPSCMVKSPRSVNAMHISDLAEEPLSPRFEEERSVSLMENKKNGEGEAAPTQQDVDPVPRRIPGKKPSNVSQQEGQENVPEKPVTEKNIEIDVTSKGSPQPQPKNEWNNADLDDLLQSFTNDNLFNSEKPKLNSHGLAKKNNSEHDYNEETETEKLLAELQVRKQREEQDVEKFLADFETRGLSKVDASMKQREAERLKAEEERKRKEKEEREKAEKERQKEIERQRMEAERLKRIEMEKKEAAEREEKLRMEAERLREAELELKRREEKAEAERKEAERKKQEERKRIELEKKEAERQELEKSRKKQERKRQRGSEETLVDELDEMMDLLNEKTEHNLLSSQDKGLIHQAQQVSTSRKGQIQESNEDEREKTRRDMLLSLIGDDGDLDEDIASILTEDVPKYVPPPSSKEPIRGRGMSFEEFADVDSLLDEFSEVNVGEYHKGEEHGDFDEYLNNDQLDDLLAEIEQNTSRTSLKRPFESVDELVRFEDGCDQEIEDIVSILDNDSSAANEIAERLVRIEELLAQKQGW